MVEQIKNEKVEQHNLSDLVQAVSENGQNNFAFGVLHCPVSFMEELMRIIALEHNSEPNQFCSAHNVAQKERCTTCSNCGAETKEVENFFSPIKHNSRRWWANFRHQRNDRWAQCVGLQLCTLLL